MSAPTRTSPGCAATTTVRSLDAATGPPTSTGSALLAEPRGDLVGDSGGERGRIHRRTPRRDAGDGGAEIGELSAERLHLGKRIRCPPRTRDRPAEGVVDDVCGAA